jgi:hypothetical protein
MLSSESEQRLPQDRYLDLISLYIEGSVFGISELPPKSKMKNMVTLTKHCKYILFRNRRVLQAMNLRSQLFFASRIFDIADEAEACIGREQADYDNSHTPISTMVPLSNILQPRSWPPSSVSALRSWLVSVSPIVLIRQNTINFDCLAARTVWRPTQSTNHAVTYLIVGNVTSSHNSVVAIKCGRTNACERPSFFAHFQSLPHVS